MRADRLLSILMLLQARGTMTAGALAEELEVSERTIYRDIDALSSAGVPVYGEAGPKGGYALLDEYRTQLTGMTDLEIRALFMLSIPAPLEGLGVDEDLRAAMRKLSASVPDERRGEEDRVRRRFLLDARWWHQTDDHVPHLRAIHRAVWGDQRLRVSYGLPFADDMELDVDAYALVAKAGVWHLVFRHRDRHRVCRVSDLVSVVELDEPFERDPEFELRPFWDSWCEGQEALSNRYPVTVRYSPAAAAALRSKLGVDTSRVEAEPGGEVREEWPEATLSFASLEDAREKLLGLGGCVEVVEPEALRRSVADYARQILATNSGS